MNWADARFVSFSPPWHGAKVVPVRRETTMDQARIGKFLQELRKEKGLTQEQLAEQLFVARRPVSRWETGANMPDLDILVELADLYDVDLRELLDGERKDETMDKEMQDTVLKVAEYSNAEKERSAKVVRVYFVLGIIALMANQILYWAELGDTFLVGMLEGITLGMALCAMLMGLLFTSGHMAKIRAFKMRLLGRA